jgi:hypothetical protein
LFDFALGVTVGAAACWWGRGLLAARAAQASDFVLEQDQRAELAKLRSELDFMSDRLGAVSTLVMLHPFQAPNIFPA